MARERVNQDAMSSSMIPVKSSTPPLSTRDLSHLESEYGYIFFELVCDCTEAEVLSALQVVEPSIAANTEEEKSVQSAMVAGCLRYLGGIATRSFGRDELGQMANPPGKPNKKYATTKFRSMTARNRHEAICAMLKDYMGKSPTPNKVFFYEIPEAEYEAKMRAVEKRRTKQAALAMDHMNALREIDPEAYAEVMRKGKHADILEKIRRETEELNDPRTDLDARGTSPDLRTGQRVDPDFVTSIFEHDEERRLHQQFLNGIRQVSGVAPK